MGGAAAGVFLLIGLVSSSRAQVFGPDNKAFPPYFVQRLSYRPGIVGATAWSGLQAFPDGKQVLSGTFATSSASSVEPRIVQLLADGALDPAFAASGSVVRNGVTTPVAVLAVQRPGIFVGAAGEFWRLNADGSRDTGFPTLTGNLVAVHPNGDFVAADANGQIVRYSRDGGREPGFNAAPIRNLAHLFYPVDRRVIAGVSDAGTLRWIRLQTDGSVDAGYTATLPQPRLAYAASYSGLGDVVVCTEEPTVVDGFMLARFTMFERDGRRSFVIDVPRDLLNIAGTAADFSIELASSSIGGMDLSRFDFGGLVTFTGGLTTIVPGVRETRYVEFAPAAGFFPHPAPTLPRGPLGPRFFVEPTSQTVTPGASVRLRAQAYGRQDMTYQWFRRGAPLSNPQPALGGSVLTLSNVQVADEGDYHVEVRNGHGAISSAAARVSLRAAPAILQQPHAVLTVTPNQSLALSLNIAGGGVSVQWLRGTTPIAANAGGMDASGGLHTVLIPRVSAGDGGIYRATVSNAFGSVGSNEVTVIVDPAAEPGRLENVSVRTHAGTGDESLIVGFVVGGEPGSVLPVLVRGAGPALASFGVSNLLADPQLTVRSGVAGIAANDDWAGNTGVASVAARVGAFPFSNAASRDAALYLPGLSPASYTVTIAGANGGTGNALAELYAAPSDDARGRARILNLSSRARVGPGDNTLIAGFVIAGRAARTVLVRGIGPALGQFGVQGTLPATDLAIFDHGGRKVAESVEYPAHAIYDSVTRAAGAFSLSGGNAVNSAILLTLPPGGYTAQLNSRVSSASGAGLIEIYEVP